MRIMRKTKCKRFCKTKCSDGGKRNALENLYKAIGSIKDQLLMLPIALCLLGGIYDDVKRLE